MPSIHFKMCELGIPWLELGLHAFTDESLGLISGPGTKIPQAMRCSHKIKNRKKK